MNQCMKGIPALSVPQLRRAVDRLSALASAIDDLKSSLPDSAQRDQLTQSVLQAHEAALFYDGLHNFGIYAGDES